MVDALREACRVLVPQGTVIDLRPRTGAWPVEAVSTSSTVAVGLLDSTAGAALDDAADAALRTAVAQRFVTPRLERTFEVSLYWRNAADLASYAASGLRPKHLQPSAGEIEAQRQALSAAGPARLRWRRQMSLCACVKEGE